MFFLNFHKKTKKFDHPIPTDSSLWPVAWKTVEYKDYKRAEKYVLPVPPMTELSDVLFRERRSKRSKSNKNYTLEDIGYIFYHSCADVQIGDDEQVRRPYPSAGARYPLEVYLIQFDSSSVLKKGVYHYAPDTHALRRVFSDTVLPVDLWGSGTKASSVIVITAMFDRMFIKYGERSYRFVLLEAGHLMQNILLTSHIRGVQTLCSGASVDIALEEKVLEIDGVTESVIGTILFS